MHLTINGLSALRITRAVRSGAISGNLNRRCDLIAPDPEPSKRWSAAALRTKLARLGHVGDFSQDRPLNVLVPSKNDRLQIKGTKSTFRMGEYPPEAFIDLGDGLAIVGPELMFVELARVMDPAAHLLLGMELCGRFSRSPDDPRQGKATYDINPATSVDRMRAFAEEAHWIRGAKKALQTIDTIVENAWSPMEALLAALLVLPIQDFGYDLWPIALNPRQELGERLARTISSASRVPDVMFTGTHVGLNYDGEDHFALEDIVAAAMECGRHPEDSLFERKLELALSDARGRIVDDKRRDRDLMAMGLSVFSVTKEDLEEVVGLDRVVLQVIEAIEAEGSRDLSMQRAVLAHPNLYRARQDFIWSLMPGTRAAEARRRLTARMHSNSVAYDYAFGPEGPNGEVVFRLIGEV